MPLKISKSDYITASPVDLLGLCLTGLFFCITMSSHKFGEWNSMNSMIGTPCLSHTVKAKKAKCLAFNMWTFALLTPKNLNIFTEKKTKQLHINTTGYDHTTAHCCWCKLCWIEVRPTVLLSLLTPTQLSISGSVWLWPIRMQKIKVKCRFKSQSGNKRMDRHNW